MKLDPFTQLQVESLLELLRKPDGLAQWIEGAVLKALRPKAEFQRLQQVPGIGPVLGMVIPLESGDFTRFASAGDYASYGRTVRSERRNNGKKKSQNNRRCGNPDLAWALAEAAVDAVRFYPKITAWHERKKKRRHVAVAMKALWCKLAKAVWPVLGGADFDEALLFG